MNNQNKTNRDIFWYNQILKILKESNRAYIPGTNVHLELGEAGI